MSYGTQPRVALFTDAFEEVNGLALTARQIDRIAGQRGMPLMLVRAASETSRVELGRDHVHIRLARSRAAIRVERDLQFDPLLWNHLAYVKRALVEFQPEVVHVTGPGDIGLLGLFLAHTLRLPVVASWHTNLHEYASCRMRKLLRFLPEFVGRSLGSVAEGAALFGLKQYYRVARVALPPNEELARLLRTMTGRPVQVMSRGVDTTFFSPAKRNYGDGVCRLGFVGRLSAEKNIRFLAALEAGLRGMTGVPFRFMIVGDGTERAWLESNLQNAEFTGVLSGEVLARAYARMDIFVFPSETDTFGNVVLEALASGVPAVVTARGGPQFIIEHGVSGFVSPTPSDFVAHVAKLISNRELRKRMSQAARIRSEQWSWDAMVDSVCSAYRMAIDMPEKRRLQIPTLPAGQCNYGPAER